VRQTRLCAAERGGARQLYLRLFLGQPILFQRAGHEPAIIRSMMPKAAHAVSAFACSLLLAALPTIGCGTSVAGMGGAPNSAAGKSGASSGAGAPSAAGGEMNGAGAMSVAGAGTSAAGTGSAGASGAGASAGRAGMLSTAGTVGSSAGSSGSAAGGASGGSGCDLPGLVWKTANKTNYTSYPEPGSEECVKFSGCLYEGLFAACAQKRSLEWVKSHNIVAAFPDLETLRLHDLCLRSGKKTIVVTVYDTCGDSDCDNCCTENKGNKDQLIDIESFTDARWGVPDGAIEWADLGPTKGTGCD
jgi:hypothetical protein